MRYRRVILCFFSLFPALLFAQMPTVLVKADEDALKVLPADYRFINKEYQDGFLTYITHEQSKRMKLNYDLYNKVLTFINEKGDTLYITDDLTVKRVQMGTSEYLHDVDNGYLKILARKDQLELGKLERLEDVRRTNPTDEGYGRLNSNGVTSNTISASRHQNVYYARTVRYYLINHENLTHATKSAFLKTFRSHEDAIKAHIEKEPVDFKNQDQLVTLFNYCLSLEGKMY